MKDDNFGFDVEKPILDATGEDYANYRYMTVMWSKISNFVLAIRSNFSYRPAAS